MTRKTPRIKITKEAVAQGFIELKSMIEKRKDSMMVEQLKAKREKCYKMKKLFHISAAITLILAIPILIMSILIGLIIIIIAYIQISWVDTEVLKTELLNIRIKQYKGDENEPI